MHQYTGILLTFNVYIVTYNVMINHHLCFKSPGDLEHLSEAEPMVWLRWSPAWGCWIGKTLPSDFFSSFWFLSWIFISLVPQKWTPFSSFPPLCGHLSLMEYQNEEYPLLLLLWVNIYLCLMSWEQEGTHKNAKKKRKLMSFPIISVVNDFQRYICSGSLNNFALRWVISGKYILETVASTSLCSK